MVNWPREFVQIFPLVLLMSFLRSRSQSGSNTAFSCHRSLTPSKSVTVPGLLNFHDLDIFKDYWPVILYIASCLGLFDISSCLYLCGTFFFFFCKKYRRSGSVVASVHDIKRYMVFVCLITGDVNRKLH